MRAALPLEDRVGAVALDRERHLLEATRLARARAEHLGREASALGVAAQHPEDVAGPERRFVPTHSLADLDDYVLGVVRVALEQGQLQVRLEAFRLEAILVREVSELWVRPRILEVLPGLQPGLRQPVGLLELFQPPARHCRARAVREDLGVAHAFLRVRVGTLEILDELVDRSHDGSILGARRACVS